MPRQSLKKRSDGRYELKYNNKHFYGKTQKEAYAKRDAYINLLNKGMRQISEKITFADYAFEWLPIKKAHVSNPTYNQYAYILNLFSESYGSYLLKNITSLHITDFYNSIQNMSKSSIAVYCSTIYSIFENAVHDGLILRNPCYNVSKPTGTSGTHRNLDDWEKKLIVSMTDHELYPFVMAMLFAGLRRGEALALNIDRDVDFVNDTITVREAVYYTTNQPILKSPKTNAGLRTIPLFKPLKNVLQGKHGLLFYQDNDPLRHATKTVITKKYSSFISSCETKLNGVSKRWYGKTKEQKAMLKDGALPAWKTFNVRMHDFRHTFCTMLYTSGVDIKTAQKWLGHADTTMILKIYAHLTQEHEKEQALNTAKTLESIFSDEKSQ